MSSIGGDKPIQDPFGVGKVKEKGVTQVGKYKSAEPKDSKKTSTMLSIIGSQIPDMIQNLGELCEKKQITPELRDQLQDRLTSINQELVQTRGKSITENTRDIARIQSIIDVHNAAQKTLNKKFRPVLVQGPFAEKKEIESDSASAKTRNEQLKSDEIKEFRSINLFNNERYNPFREQAEREVDTKIDDAQLVVDHQKASLNAMKAAIEEKEAQIGKKNRERGLTQNASHLLEAQMKLEQTSIEEGEVKKRELFKKLKTLSDELSSSQEKDPKKATKRGEIEKQIQFTESKIAQSENKITEIQEQLKKELKNPEAIGEDEALLKWEITELSNKLKQVESDLSTSEIDLNALKNRRDDDIKSKFNELVKDKTPKIPLKSPEISKSRKKTVTEDAKSARVAAKGGEFEISNRRMAIHENLAKSFDGITSTSDLLNTITDARNFLIQEKQELGTFGQVLNEFLANLQERVSSSYSDFDAPAIHRFAADWFAANKSEDYSQEVVCNAIQAALKNIQVQQAISASGSPKELQKTFCSRMADMFSSFFGSKTPSTESEKAVTKVAKDVVKKTNDGTITPETLNDAAEEIESQGAKQSGLFSSFCSSVSAAFRSAASVFSKMQTDPDQQLHNELKNCFNPGFFTWKLSPKDFAERLDKAIKLLEEKPSDTTEDIREFKSTMNEVDESDMEEEEFSQDLEGNQAFKSNLKTALQSLKSQINTESSTADIHLKTEDLGKLSSFQTGVINAIQNAAKLVPASKAKNNETIQKLDTVVGEAKDAIEEATTSEEVKAETQSFLSRLWNLLPSLSFSSKEARETQESVASLLEDFVDTKISTVHGSTELPMDSSVAEMRRKAQQNQEDQENAERARAYMAQQDNSEFIPNMTSESAKETASKLGGIATEANESSDEETQQVGVVVRKFAEVYSSIANCLSSVQTPEQKAYDAMQDCFKETWTRKLLGSLAAAPTQNEFKDAFTNLDTKIAEQLNNATLNDSAKTFLGKLQNAYGRRSNENKMKIFEVVEVYAGIRELELGESITEDQKRLLAEMKQFVNTVSVSPIEQAIKGMIDAVDASTISIPQRAEEQLMVKVSDTNITQAQTADTLREFQRSIEGEYKTVDHWISTNVGDSHKELRAACKGYADAVQTHLNTEIQKQAAELCKTEIVTLQDYFHVTGLEKAQDKLGVLKLLEELNTRTADGTVMHGGKVVLLSKEVKTDLQLDSFADLKDETTLNEAVNSVIKSLVTNQKAGLAEFKGRYDKLVAGMDLAEMPKAEEIPADHRKEAEGFCKEFKKAYDKAVKEDTKLREAAVAAAEVKAKNAQAAFEQVKSIASDLSVPGKEVVKAAKTSTKSAKKSEHTGGENEVKKTSISIDQDLLQNRNKWENKIDADIKQIKTAYVEKFQRKEEGGAKTEFPTE